MAVGFCGVVLACGGPEERKAMYRTRAQDYVQQGNYPKARVALRNALKIDPNDTESWFLFAQVEEREQNWRNAYGDYLRVVELQPDHEAALIRLGKIYLEVAPTTKPAKSPTSCSPNIQAMFRDRPCRLPWKP